MCLSAALQTFENGSAIPFENNRIAKENDRVPLQGDRGNMLTWAIDSTVDRLLTAVSLGRD
ncbi:hypothetical protein IFM46972_07374 [Aspergillus udagawae]|uniref:Uncharacterized protein n=1 Tax=Aspergillus udagawae TaxID=91492 RepID=A0A8H3S4Z8_9EURO|nr:hypothetical protein IFM46972_07374 [Aspergillus udagawae]